MCDACFEPGELNKEFLAEAIENARKFMGPVYMTPQPESDYVRRFVLGWHEALNYMEKEAGLA